MIQGGVPLSGEITAAGNKNAALPILAACLLTEEDVVLRNVPRIRDTEAQIAILANLGVEVEWLGDNDLRLCAANVGNDRGQRGARGPDPRLVPARRPAAGAVRGGAMPPPGGDTIGRRRLDPHLDAFRDLGAAITGSRMIELQAPGGLEACEIFMDEPSVMGTENALLAAALTPGRTVIANSASEPHVQDLAHAADPDGRAASRGSART